MIPFSPIRLETAGWQRDMADLISDPRELLALLDLDPGDVPYVDFDSDNGFEMRVTRYFAGLMRRGDPRDPLLLQVLPALAERQAVPGFAADPVGDLDAVREPGLLQKYRGRALTITTGACAIHCRYCFRRHFPYAGQSLLKHWPQTLETLRDLPDVNELILSGGDPLSLSDGRLASLIDDAEGIDRLTRLRIHTRLPVVLPRRITRQLCDRLNASRLQIVVVLHANHPNEITPVLGESVAHLAAAGASILNQSVLLKSVNDDADTLARLSESLFAIRVMPYYLHLLDPVAGAAHFDVPLETALNLSEILRSRLPGYLVPRMVREVAGGPSKTPAFLL